MQLCNTFLLTEDPENVILCDTKTIFARKRKEIHYAERDALLDEKVTEMYESADIESALSRVYLGEEGEEDVIAYAWTTVCAPSGSGAEEAATISGVPFQATTEPEKPDNSFLGRVKRFFGKIKTLVMRLINWIKFGLAILKK